MIHENDRLDRFRAMAASIAVHAAVFAALFHAVDFTTPSALQRHAVAISLAAFGSAGDAETAPKAVSTPHAPAEKKVVKPTMKRTVMPAKTQPAPAQPVETAAAVRPVPSPKIPLPQTPEVKAPQPDPAPLSEASASTPSQAVTSAASEISPPTPGLKRKQTLLSDPSNGIATGPDATVLGQIRAMIEQAVTYPAVARRLRIEGVVTLSFMLTPNGHVAKAEVLRSSGSTVLDRKALNTLWELSGGFPSLESATQLTIPIAFTLKNS